MSTKYLTYCDICGKEIPDNIQSKTHVDAKNFDRTRILSICSVTDHHFLRGIADHEWIRADVCEACQKNFRLFIISCNPSLYPEEKP